MPERSKVVHARLIETEIAALNLLMQRYRCKNLADLLRLVVGGKIAANSIAGDIAEIKDKLYTIVDGLGMGSRVENGVTNLLDKSIAVAESESEHELFPASDPQGITGGLTLYLLPHSLRGARCCTAG